LAEKALVRYPSTSIWKHVGDEDVAPRYGYDGQ